MQNHTLEMSQAIIFCFEKQYGNLYSGETEVEVNVNSNHGDHILFDVCHFLNCNLCPKPTSNVEACTVELNTFLKNFDHYSDIKMFKSFIVDDVLKVF